MFRGFAGVASAFALPSAVSLINETFPAGKSRNIAFSAMGGGQPVGFAFGLVIGGAVAGSIGWRWGFYFTAIIGFIVLGLSAWQLPQSRKQLDFKGWHQLTHETDWVGAFIASSSLAMFSYALA